MARLVLRPWDMDAPCHTHGCYGRIAWKIVPDELEDVTAAIVAGLCDDCRRALVQSGASDLFERESEHVDRRLVLGYVLKHKDDTEFRQAVLMILGVKPKTNKQNASQEKGEEGQVKADAATQVGEGA